MGHRWGRQVVAFSALQLGDAVACAIPLDYIRRDLDRIGCPEPVRRALAPIKGAAAIGLLVGLGRPRVGRITAAALAAYFLAAIGFHVRAKDPPAKALPAASLMMTSCVLALRAFGTAA